jgi:tRNA A-37 threonylcarbamoyl transferase component Bud32
MSNFLRENRFSLPMPYNDPKSNVLLGVLITFMPIWGVWMPYRIFESPAVQNLLIAPMDFLPPNWWNQPQIWYPDHIFKEIGIIVSLFCLVALFMLLDRRLIINHQGIRFPTACLGQLRGMLFRNWDELVEVRITCSRMLHCRPGKISFVFASDAVAHLDFESMNRNQWQKLFIAIHTYAPHAKMDSHVQEVHANFVGNDIVLHPFTYARVWRDELTRRFNSTVFVPREAGDRLQDGRYEVEGQLAFGGLSAIYVARSKDNARVVLKEAVVPADASEETAEKARELFQREALMLQRLEHEGIARVFDHFVEGGRNYMVLEYIPGKDLRQLVTNCGAQAPNTVLHWAKEIATIMVYLHGKNPPIVHRDLTPDNLVLRNDGTITLIDFGAANHFLGTATGTMVGKQSYMAPEQLRGKAHPASDIYSFGATLFFLLTGQDPEPLSQSHVREVKPEIPETIADLIAQCTQLESERRPAGFQEILQRLKGEFGKSSPLAGTGTEGEGNQALSGEQYIDKERDEGKEEEDIEIISIAGMVFDK